MRCFACVNLFYRHFKTQNVKFTQTYPSISSLRHRLKVLFFTPLYSRERDYIWWKFSRPLFVRWNNITFKIWKTYRYERLLVIQAARFIRLYKFTPLILFKYADILWTTFTIKHSVYFTFTHLNVKTHLTLLKQQHTRFI